MAAAPKVEPDATFPVSLAGTQHWGVRVSGTSLPGYFAAPLEATIHLALMKYRREHDGALPLNLEKFAAAQSGQRRGDRAP